MKDKLRKMANQVRKGQRPCPKPTATVKLEPSPLAKARGARGENVLLARVDGPICPRCKSSEDILIVTVGPRFTEDGNYPQWCPRCGNVWKS